MIAIRIVPVFGAILALAACAEPPPPEPVSIVLPASGKTMAAFQADDSICRQHATEHTGYGDVTPPRQGWNVPVRDVPNAAPPPAAAPNAAPPPAAVPNAAPPPAAVPEPPETDLPSQPQYLQCMAARGNIVTFLPPWYAAPEDWDDYPYPYDWAYAGYDFWPYGLYAGGFIAVYGNGFHGAPFQRRFFHDRAGFRAFAQRGGFGHGGHTGGAHGGGFHGGGGGHH